MIMLGLALDRFGENLDPEVLSRAQQAVNDADLFITVGTSSCVYPAAGFAAQVPACWLFAPVAVSSLTLPYLANHALRAACQ